MLRYPRHNSSAAQPELLDRVLKEYLAMLESRPDDSLSKYNLGNYHQLRGDRSAAVAAYETSVRLDPANLLPLVNVSMLTPKPGNWTRRNRRFAAPWRGNRTMPRQTSTWASCSPRKAI